MGDVLLPILKDNKDPHYRYKMPKLTAKVEGSGNGIKTVITNMDAISRSLDRPPAYATKYFGCELGAQVTMNNEIYIVNGSHDPEKLLQLLYGFIRKFVLCPKCNNPETKLSVVGQVIHQKCIACGHANTINKAIHKLTTYIINHPVDGVSNTNVKTKSSKKSKKGGNTSPTNGNTTNNHNHNGNGDSGNDNNAHKDNEDDDFNDFDDEELTPAAYQERMRELCDGLNNDMYLSNTKENANIFYEMVKEKKEKNQLQDNAIQKELVAEAERLQIKDKATLILSELLFTENILEEIKTHRILFLRFCHDNMKAQKYLLGGFEKLVGDVYRDALFTSVCKILMMFYEMDILDEEVIIEWSKKPSKKYVSKDVSKLLHEKAAPFIKWLKEAEVEEESDEKEDSKPSSNGSASASNKAKVNGSTTGKRNDPHRRSHSDDEDDDGIDLEFSHRVSGMHIESVKPVETPKAINADVVAANGDQGDEDLDIDNI